MYNGITIRIGEEDYIVPPISLGQLRNGLLAKMQEHDRLISDNKAFEAMNLRGEIILAAIRRNYPDFPEQKLYDYLDLGNSGPVWLGILGASGFMGEARAATATATVGTSSPSTEASPQPTAGPIQK
jgi:hypothetical protein